jgi:hypothetical protein
LFFFMERSSIDRQGDCPLSTMVAVNCRAYRIATSPTLAGVPRAQVRFGPVCRHTTGAPQVGHRSENSPAAVNVLAEVSK